MDVIAVNSTVGGPEWYHTRGDVSCPSPNPSKLCRGFALLVLAICGNPVLISYLLLLHINPPAVRHKKTWPLAKMIGLSMRD